MEYTIFSHTCVHYRGHDGFCEEHEVICGDAAPCKDYEEEREVLHEHDRT